MDQEETHFKTLQAHFKDSLKKEETARETYEKYREQDRMAQQQMDESRNRAYTATIGHLGDGHWDKLVKHSNIHDAYQNESLKGYGSDTTPKQQRTESVQQNESVSKWAKGSMESRHEKELKNANINDGSSKIQERHTLERQLFDTQQLHSNSRSAPLDVKKHKELTDKLLEGAVRDVEKIEKNSNERLEVLNHDVIVDSKFAKDFKSYYAAKQSLNETATYRNDLSDATNKVQMSQARMVDELSKGELTAKERAHVKAFGDLDLGKDRESLQKLGQSQNLRQDILEGKFQKQAQDLKQASNQSLERSTISAQTQTESQTAQASRSISQPQNPAQNQADKRRRFAQMEYIEKQIASGALKGDLSDLNSPQIQQAQENFSKEWTQSEARRAQEVAASNQTKKETKVAEMTQAQNRQMQSSHKKSRGM